jgi:hypothetical protein
MQLGMGAFGAVLVDMFALDVGPNSTLFRLFKHPPEARSFGVSSPLKAGRSKTTTRRAVTTILIDCALRS